MAQTLVEKIASHKLDRAVSAGETVELPVDLMWGSEMTVWYAVEALTENGFLDGKYDEQLRKQAERMFTVADHFILPTVPAVGEKMEAIKNLSRRLGYGVFEPSHDGGIQHRIFEMRGMIMPYDVGVGADSHSCSPGAIGAMMTGFGSTDLAVAMLTGSIPMRIPETIKINFTGAFKEGVSAKDIILYLNGLFGESGANYRAIEFTGPGVASIPAYQRFTVSNMVVELGAKFGLWPVDDETINYLRNTKQKFPAHSRFKDKDIEFYRTLQVDNHANYVFEFEVNLGNIAPMAALPHSPANVLDVFQLREALDHFEEMSPNIQARLYFLREALGKTGAQREIPIKGVYFGGCTSTRDEDIRRVSAVLKGQVAPGLLAIINPASEADTEGAKKSGALDAFHKDGWVTKGEKCGQCFGGSDAWTDPGIYVTVGNRNFRGRSGSADEVYVILTGGELAVRTAEKGVLTSHLPQELFYPDQGSVRAGIIDLDGLTSRLQAELTQTRYNSSVESYDKPPEGKRLRVWRFGDDINTDLMMNHKACKIPEIEKAVAYFMADANNTGFNDHLAEARYDLSNDIIVGSHNFGCGSSRENAAAAVRYTKLPAVVAGSFARIFYRNAANLGITLFEIGDAVRDIEQGNDLVLDFKEMRVYNVTKSHVYQAKQLPETIQTIVDAGGALPLAKTRITIS